MCFSDLEKAFNRVCREDIWKALGRRGIDEETTGMVKTVYEKNRNCIQSNNEEPKEFTMDIGIKQEHLLSPLLFSVVMDESTMEARKKVRKVKPRYRRLEIIQV